MQNSKYNAKLKIQNAKNAKCKNIKMSLFGVGVII